MTPARKIELARGHRQLGRMVSLTTLAPDTVSVFDRAVDTPVGWAAQSSGQVFKKDLTFCLSHRKVEFFQKDSVQLLRVPH